MPEKFPSHILCPVDFSELSAAALQYTARLSGQCASDVTAVHAYWFEVPPYFTPGRAVQLKAQYEEAASELGEALKSFTAKAGMAKARIRIEEGDPAGSIVRAAANVKADLIVMGTHGRHGFQRFLMGSVAERILRMSWIPVLTVRGPAGGKIERIVCPVNNSAASRRAFQKAARLAACIKAQLTAVHIEEDDSKMRIDDVCGWIAQGERPECKVEYLRGSGKPAEEILKLTAALSVDLLVIGAAHQTFFDSTILGSTTVRVVRHANCPVLTVPEGAGEKQDDLSASIKAASQ